VYRELLLERLAQVVGLTGARLEALWTGAKTGAPATPPASRDAARRLAPARPPRGAGRGSLVRQAIIRLLHYPAIALEVTASERAGLDASEEPGVPLLRELLDDLREQPAQIPAQVIQRWMGHKEGETLQKLLAREEVITGAAAATEELRAALTKLADQAAGRRLQALEAKSRAGSLAAEELLEFQRLIERLSHRDAHGG
jgi:DNA primase